MRLEAHPLISCIPCHSIVTYLFNASSHSCHILLLTMFIIYIYSIPIHTHLHEASRIVVVLQRQFFFSSNRIVIHFINRHKSMHICTQPMTAIPNVHSSGEMKQYVACTIANHHTQSRLLHPHEGIHEPSRSCDLHTHMSMAPNHLLLTSRTDMMKKGRSTADLHRAFLHSERPTVIQSLHAKYDMSVITRNDMTLVIIKGSGGLLQIDPLHSSPASEKAATTIHA